ncbi:hypothetical protein Ciccas_001812 [Cichlidogyrus casuarinus]|uniref:Carboxylesterase type B domain-containing protein n=1 Tax=Cichlidogyrus casuarinus TaxID=1844966 RepID=A0ABD2QIZ6_9PLAT
MVDLYFIKHRHYRPKSDYFPDGIPTIDFGVAGWLSRPFDVIIIMAIIVLSIACLISGAISFLIEKSTDSLNPFIDMPCGKYKGKWNENQDIISFYGIPYTVPPITEPIDRLKGFLPWPESRRWRNSIKLDDSFEHCLLSHVKRCEMIDSRWNCDFSEIPKISTCSSYAFAEDDFKASLGEDEDCLTMDIKRPKQLLNEPTNVIVVVATEAGVADAMKLPIGKEKAFVPSDATVLEFGAIWVRVSIRVGFYSTFEGENFAASDLVNSLSWVTRNIGYFGGDPNKVTLLAFGSAATLVFKMLHLGEAVAMQLPIQIWLSSPAVPLTPSKNAINFYDELYAIYMNTNPRKTECGKKVDKSEKCKAEIKNYMISKDTSFLFSIEKLRNKFFKFASVIGRPLSLSSLFEDTMLRSDWFGFLINNADSNKVEWLQKKRIFVVHGSNELEEFPGIENLTYKSSKLHLEKLLGKIGLEEYETTYLEDSNDERWEKMFLIRLITIIKFICPVLKFKDGSKDFNYLINDQYLSGPVLEIATASGLRGGVLNFGFRSLDIAAITGNLNKMENEVHLRRIFKDFALFRNESLPPKCQEEWRK